MWMRAESMSIFGVKTPEQSKEKKSMEPYQGAGI